MKCIKIDKHKNCSIVLLKLYDGKQFQV